MVVKVHTKELAIYVMTIKGWIRCTKFKMQGYFPARIGMSNILEACQLT